MLNQLEYVQFVMEMELFIISTYHATKNLFVLGKKMIKYSLARSVCRTKKMKQKLKQNTCFPIS